MLQGETQITEDLEFKKTIWEDSWKEFYSHGYTNPDFTILKVISIQLRGWHKGHHQYIFIQRTEDKHVFVGLQ
ncbi:MAG: hypothetical protein ACTSYD_15050 [Candidatus Heimdallarchaeaceae archaeon]